MKRILDFSVAILIAFILQSCGDEKPNVSGISISLDLQRFEEDFFKIDTNDIPASFTELKKKYPIFMSDFTHNILGLPPVHDTATQVAAAIRQFISDYRPLKDSSDRIFGDFEKYKKEIEKGLQYTKHYFPNYALPQKIITFIGPMDAYYEASLGGYGDVITADALAIGLQLHLGKDFSLYHSAMGQALYPTYISRRFEPEYIAVNCVKNILDDLFPDLSAGRPLVEQMVEKGKRVYVLDKLLPDTQDTLITGYTKKQLQGCYSNEGLIWNFFLTNSLLYNGDPGVIKNYIGDAPSTPEFGEGAPGYIGLFTGWQIVKKYMENNAGLSFSELMKKDPRQVFEESKYRPR